MTKRSLLNYWGPLLGVVFLTLFPRAGFLIGDIPITWGYAFFCGAGVFLLTQNPFIGTIPRMQAILSLLPFQILSAFTLAYFGTRHIGFSLSFLFSLFLLPLLSFLSFSSSLEELDKAHLIQLLRKATQIIAVLGILFLALYHLTGEHWGIPFLTTESLSPNHVLTKHNMRSAFTKLVSTYNNGNIFGLCLLMLFPLTRRQPILYLALFLTLSRTIWIALLFQEFLSFFWIDRNLKRLFWVCTLSILYIATYSFFFHQDLFFLFDPYWGGRLNGSFSWEPLTYAFGRMPFRGIHEMVYYSLAQNFGFVGLASYLLGVSMPLILYAKREQKSQIQTQIAIGLLTYLFASISDGALLYIPVLAFYWILSSLLLGSSKSFLDGEKALAQAASYPQVPSRSPWLMPYRGV